MLKIRDSGENNGTIIHEDYGSVVIPEQIIFGNKSEHFIESENGTANLSDSLK